MGICAGAVVNSAHHPSLSTWGPSSNWLQPKYSNLSRIRCYSNSSNGGKSNDTPKDVGKSGHCRLSFTERYS